MSIAELPAVTALCADGGLPGFPDAHHFQRVPWGGGATPFSILESDDREGLAFVVAPPGLFFADYLPVFDRPTLDRIGASNDPAEIEVLVILTLGETVADATANLLGPLVVNRATGAMVQAVLSGTGWSARAALVPSR